MCPVEAASFAASITVGGVAVNAAGLPLARTAAETEGAARTLFIVFAVIVTLGVPLGVVVSRRALVRAAVPQPAE